MWAPSLLSDAVLWPFWSVGVILGLKEVDVTKDDLRYLNQLTFGISGPSAHIILS